MKIKMLQWLVASACGAASTAACGTRTPADTDVVIASPVPPEPAPSAPAAPPESPPESLPNSPPPADAVAPEPTPIESPPAALQVDIEPETGLPRYWSPLFTAGRKSAWSLTVERVTAEPPPEDGGPAPEPTTTTLVFEIACEVASVAPAVEKPSVRAAVVTCSGFDGSGIDLGPQGNWFSDGQDLWRAGEVDGERSLELAALPAPRTWQHGEGDDITTMYRVAAGPEPESWCHTEGFVLGDGGEIVVCFDKARGPYRFEGKYAGPMEALKATLTLR